MRMFRLGALVAGSLVIAGCPNATGQLLGPIPGTTIPIITRLEVAPNPQTPSGPFQLWATASGTGTLTYDWFATGGVLSVASESIPASVLATPSVTAWIPPQSWGRYHVTLTVMDPVGNFNQRSVHFEVGRQGVTVLSPWALGPGIGPAYRRRVDDRGRIIIIP